MEEGRQSCVISRQGGRVEGVEGVEQWREEEEGRSEERRGREEKRASAQVSQELPCPTLRKLI